MNHNKFLAETQDPMLYQLKINGQVAELVDALHSNLKKVYKMGEPWEIAVKHETVLMYRFESCLDHSAVILFFLSLQIKREKELVRWRNW